MFPVTAPNTIGIIVDQSRLRRKENRRKEIDRPAARCAGATGPAGPGRSDAFAKIAVWSGVSLYAGTLPFVPRFDLHAHSTHSDGLLTPTELVQRAAARGVDVLALTDHDELSGLSEAEAAAAGSPLRLVGGVEVSVSWRDITLHVLGLRIDPGCPALRDGLGRIRAGRAERARRIGASLAQAGIPDAYEGALRFCTSERLISRTHFARFLVEAGHVRELRDVFRRFLVRGK